MKYCTDCGRLLTRPTNSRNSATTATLHCGTCDKPQHRYPALIASCLVEWQGQVLLCRRSLEPALGLWALPGSHVAPSEPIQAAAARAVREQARATVDELALFRVYNLPKLNEVIVIFRGTLRDGRFSLGEHTGEVAMFPKRQLPWDDLAFEATRSALHGYATRRWQSVYGTPVEDLVWQQPPTARGRAAQVPPGPALPWVEPRLASVRARST